MNKPDRLDYPKFNGLIALLLFFYVGTFYLQAGARIAVLGTIRFEFLLAAILMVMALIYKSEVQYEMPKVIWPLAFFIFCLIIQVPLSIDVDYSYLKFVERVLKFLVMGIFIARFIDNPKMLMVFLAAFLLSCFKMGQEGLVGNITGSMIWEGQGVMRLRGTTSLYAHPNSYAGMAVGTLPFIYYLYPISGKYLRVIYLIGLVMALNIIVYSGSRTGYLGFIGMLLVVFWRSKYKQRFVAVGLVCVLVGLVAVPEQYVGRFESIFSGKDEEGQSIEKRKQILSDGIDVFIRHPFGVGLGAFPSIRAAYFGRGQDTHNLYLEIATNLGVQGLAAFFLLFGVVIKGYVSLRQAFSKQLVIVTEQLSNNPTRDKKSLMEQHRWHLQLYLATTNAVFTYLWIRLVLGLFGHDLYEIYWWFVLGFLFALSKLRAIAENRTQFYCGKSNLGNERLSINGV